MLPARSAIAEVTAADFLDAFRVNALGPFMITQNLHLLEGSGCFRYTPWSACESENLP